jgi:hypothetical protein
MTSFRSTMLVLKSSTTGRSAATDAGTPCHGSDNHAANVSAATTTTHAPLPDSGASGNASRQSTGIPDP